MPAVKLCSKSIIKLFAKIKKDLVSTHSQKLGLSITQSKQN